MLMTNSRERQARVDDSGAQAGLVAVAEGVVKAAVPDTDRRHDGLVVGALLLRAVWVGVAAAGAAESDGPGPRAAV